MMGTPVQTLFAAALMIGSMGAFRPVSAGAVPVDPGLADRAAASYAEVQEAACPEPLLRAGAHVQVATQLASDSQHPHAAFAGLPATITEVVRPDAGSCPLYKLDLDSASLTWSRDEIEVITQESYTELAPLRLTASHYVPLALLAYLLAESELGMTLHEAAYAAAGGQEARGFAGLRALARHAALTAEELAPHQTKPWLHRWIERADLDEAPVGERHFALFSLGMAHYDSGDFQGAVEAFSRAVELVEGAIGQFHPDIPVASRVQLARSWEGQRSLWERQNSLTAAIESYRKALTHLGDRSETGGITRGQIQLELAIALKESGDLTGAAEWLSTSIETFSRSGREGSQGWAAAVLSLARLHRDGGRDAEAEKFYQLLRAKALSNLSADPAFWANVATSIASDLTSAGRSVEAIELVQKALNGIEELPNPPAVTLSEMKLAIAQLLLSQDPRGSLNLCQEISGAAPAPPPRLRARALLCVGNVFVLLGMPQEAERELLEARKIIQTGGFSDLRVGVEHLLSTAYANAGRSHTSQQLLSELPRGSKSGELVPCGRELSGMAPQFADDPGALFQLLLQLAAWEINAGDAFKANMGLMAAQDFWKECLKEEGKAAVPLVRLAAVFEHKMGNSQKAENLLLSALSTAIVHYPEWFSLHSAIAFDLFEFAQGQGNEQAAGWFLRLATALALAGKDRLQLARSMTQIASWYQKRNAIPLAVFFAKMAVEERQFGGGRRFCGSRASGAGDRRNTYADRSVARSRASFRGPKDGRVVFSANRELPNI